MHYKTLPLLLIILLISPRLCRGNSHFEPELLRIENASEIRQIRNAEIESDDWLAPDKFDHFLGSAMLSCCGTLALKVNHNNPDDAGYIAVSVTIGLGATKELYDMTSPSHHPSWKDLTVDIAGALLGMLVAKSF